MAKSVVVRQFFMDLIDNLGYHVDVEEAFEEEESTMILTDLFFSGRLEMKWNPETDTLMLKPTIEINIKEGDIGADLIRIGEELTKQCT